jgi:hypothetical protein
MGGGDAGLGRFGRRWRSREQARQQEAGQGQVQVAAG